MTHDITEDDIEQVQQWISTRRQRVENLTHVMDTNHQRYGEVLEDAEMCDILMDILDRVKASDLCVESIGKENYG